jgi:hypothetical protein
MGDNFLITVQMCGIMSRATHAVLRTSHIYCIGLFTAQSCPRITTTSTWLVGS